MGDFHLFSVWKGLEGLLIFGYVFRYAILPILSKMEHGKLSEHFQTIKKPSESDSALVHYALGGAFEKALARAKISVGQDSDLLCEYRCK